MAAKFTHIEGIPYSELMKVEFFTNKTPKQIKDYLSRKVTDRCEPIAGFRRLPFFAKMSDARINLFLKQEEEAAQKNSVAHLGKKPKPLTEAEQVEKQQKMEIREVMIKMTQEQNMAVMIRAAYKRMLNQGIRLSIKFIEHYGETKHSIWPEPEDKVTQKHIDFITQHKTQFKCLLWGEPQTPVLDSEKLQRVEQSIGEQPLPVLEAMVAIQEWMSSKKDCVAFDSIKALWMHYYPELAVSFAVVLMINDGVLVEYDNGMVSFAGKA